MPAAFRRSWKSDSMRWFVCDIGCRRGDLLVQAVED